MSAIVWPDDLAPTQASFWLESNSALMESAIGRAQQVIIRAPQRWRISMVYDPVDASRAARLDALLASMDGGAREVSIFDFRRPTPRGAASANPGAPIDVLWAEGTGWGESTVWGTFTPPTVRRLRLAAAAGDTALDVEGFGGSTTILRAGDLLGIDGQLVMVTDDVVSGAGGRALVPIVPSLRRAVAAQTAIIVDRPRIRARLLGSGVNAPMRAGVRATYSFELVEALP